MSLTTLLLFLDTLGSESKTVTKHCAKWEHWVLLHTWRTFRENCRSSRYTDPRPVQNPNPDRNHLASTAAMVSDQWSGDTRYQIWTQARPLQPANEYRSEALSWDLNDGIHTHRNTHTEQNKQNDPHRHVKNKQGFAKYQSRSLIYWVKKSIVFSPFLWSPIFP